MTFSASLGMDKHISFYSLPKNDKRKIS